MWIIQYSIHYWYKLPKLSNDRYRICTLIPLDWPIGRTVRSYIKRTISRSNGVNVKCSEVHPLRSCNDTFTASPILLRRLRRQTIDMNGDLTWVAAQCAFGAEELFSCPCMILWCVEINQWRIPLYIIWEAFGGTGFQLRTLGKVSCCDSLPLAIANLSLFTESFVLNILPLKMFAASIIAVIYEKCMSTLHLRMRLQKSC